MAYPGEIARTRPDHPAVVMAGSGATQSYGELDERSNQLAQLCRAHGLEPGDHIAVFMENQLHYMEVVWAALRSGLYVTAINSYLSAPEVAYIVEDSESQVVVTSTARLDIADAIDRATTPSATRWLVVGDDERVDGDRWESYETAIAEHPTTPVDDARPGQAMLYSSGTTGRPKGIKRPLPEHALDELDVRMTSYTIPAYQYSEDMIYLSPAPMYHAAPLAFSTAVHRVGGTLVILEKFDPVGCLRAMQDHHVTHAQFVPTMFVRMLKLDEQERSSFDLSALRVAFHAAAPCPVDVKRQMIEWWGPLISEYYAGTEGNGATFIDSEQWLRKPGSVGRIMRGNLHIVGPDGEDLPPGEIGGVYFSGAGHFEYHNAPEKTADASLPGGRTTLGDVGYVDEDGYLFLTDRKAHMIISGGVNIYPQEVEDCLIGHPSVADVAVFGVPDQDMGEQVKAVVQPIPGVDGSDELAADLIAYAREHIAHFKCPKSVDFEAELPRLPTGKLYKRLLRDRYWGKTDSTIV